MCDGFPLTCGNGGNPLFDSAAKMAVPGFNVIQSAYDKICANLKELQKSPAFKNGSPNTMKLYQKLMNQKECFLQAILDHPGYEDFVSQREKKRQENAEKNKSLKQLSEGERKEFWQKWKKMCLPRKTAYLGSLATINRALASLTEDRYWCQYPAKKRLFKFLVVRRNMLCRKLAKFPPVPAESRECFRFKPCSLKIVKAWEVQYKNRRGNISRKLSVDFDDVSKRLGLPKNQSIDESILKYQKFISSIKEKINSSLVESEDERNNRLEELDAKLQGYERRVNFLKDLKTECEASRNRQADMLKAICDEKYGPVEPKEIKPEIKKKKEWVFNHEVTSVFPPPGYWQDYNSLKPFSHNLEMPSKLRLQNILEYQKKLLNEIERIDKIKEGPQGSKEKKKQTENTPQPEPSKSKNDNKSQSKSKSNKVDDDSKKKNKKKKKEDINEETHVVDENQSEPKATTAAGGIQKNSIRSLKEGISSNIKFIEELIVNYPEPFTTHNCKPNFETMRCKPKIEKETKRKEFSISSEACGESFTRPKLSILKATHEKFEELIKKFEADVGNKEALEAFFAGNDDAGEEGDEKQEKSKFLKSPEEMEKELKEKDLKSRLRVYQKMVEARDKVANLCAQHEDRWNQLISQGSGGISFYSHNLVCNREEEVMLAKPKEYKLTHPRKDLYIAHEKRMRAALEKHLTWIEEKLKIKGIEKDEIEKVLWEMKNESDEGESSEEDPQGLQVTKGNTSKGDEEDEEADEVQYENKSRFAGYARRYVNLKFNLERLLATLDSQTDEDKNQVFHALACKRSDNMTSTVFDFSKEGPADLKYTEMLAQPKKILLKSTYESFAKVMSCEKQRRILCQLNKVREPSRPEDLEASVRGVVKSKRKSRCVAGKIKLQVARQLYDELSRVLKKKIALEMSKATTPTPVSVPFREIEKTILTILMIINGSPRSSQECDMYHKFASILRNFIVEALQKDLK